MLDFGVAVAVAVAVDRRPQTPRERAVTFAELFERWRWLPLRGCPGRFVLRGAPAGLSPAELVGEDILLHRYRVPAAADEVLLAVLTDGGLLSYRRDDGTCVHTLNTPEGLARKLAQLGIAAPPANRSVL